MSTKQPRQRAHQPAPNDAGRFSLNSLTFNHAVRRALATKLPRDDAKGEASGDA